MNTKKTWNVLVACAIGGTVIAAQSARADGRDDRHDPRHERDRREAAPRFRGEIERFHEHDWDMWRGGRWRHDVHGGRWGWWWIVGGSWYFYPEPVYPYPNPYEPPIAAVVPPTAAPQSAPPPPPQNWYYCNAPKGYYPYVPSCPAGWEVVPATPNLAPPPR